MARNRTDIPTDMPTHNRPRNLGSSMNDQTSRLDAVAKVTGTAKYGRDWYLDRQLQLAFIRCPYGAAEMTAADVAAARAVPGVMEVVIEGREGRYHGHTLGYVVGETAHAVRRAIKALNLQWRRNPVTTTISDSRAPDPPPMDDEMRRALENADHVLEAKYTTVVQTHSPLESHGAAIDHQGDRAIAYVSTQGTFATLDGLPDALELPASDVIVSCEYVGGGFGSKLNGAGKEGQLAARIAAKYRRPTYLFTDREEDHLDTGNRPSSRTWVKIGFNDDGTIVGGQIHTWGGVGIAQGGGGVRIPSGRYNYPAQKGREGHTDVQFNAGGPRAMRAPGHPQGTFAEELMLDEIATICEVDPVDLRLRLDVAPDRRDMFILGRELIGWGHRQKTGSQTGVIRRGFGCGGTDWGRFPSRAEAEVAINRDGSVEVRTGTQDIGTGMRTVAGVVAAQTLGVPLARVRVAIGQSTLPPGPASGGSVTSHNTAPAIMAAADDAKRRFLDAAAQALGENADGLNLADGNILHHNEPVMTFDEACAKLNQDRIVGRGERDREAERTYGGEGHSQGAQFVDLDVDTETGVIRVNRIVAIQACGKVVCRKTAESQIIGGVIQGVSYALFENKLLDRNTGAMVNANLEWYKVAGTDDMPTIEPVLWEKGQTGVRSLGEPPTIPTAGAIACALFNALGRPVRHLPLTPDKVLAAVEGGSS